MRALSRAGLAGRIDLSAFGMIRALAGDPTPVSRATSSMLRVRPAVLRGTDRRAGSGPGRGSRSAPRTRPGEALLQPRRRHQPGGRPRRDCVFTRVSPFGIEGIAQKLAERRRSPWSTPASGSSTWGWSSRSRPSRATRRRSAARATRSPRARRGWWTSFGSRSSTTRRRKAPYRRGGRRLWPRNHDPGLTERLARDLGQRFGLGGPQPSPIWTGRRRPA